MVILDTNILINVLRQKETYTPLLVSLIQQYDCAISVVTVGELYSGKKTWTHPHAKTDLELLLSGLKILPLTTPIAIKAGELRAIYDLDLEDAFIAATALETANMIATENKKHFGRVPQLKIVN